MQPEQSKLEAVKDYPTPTSKKQVRTFLGLTGYYRKFIPAYADLAATLTDLTRKSTPNRAHWTEECNRASLSLKEALCSQPILRSPDFDRVFTLQTDASDRGVGAVLSQTDENGQEHPVAYFSRNLLPRETRYSTVEKEWLAIN